MLGYGCNLAVTAIRNAAAYIRNLLKPFDTPSWWVASGGFSLSGNTAVGNGTSGALETPVLSSLVFNESYRITFDMTRSGGSIQLNLGGNTSAIINTSGSKSVTLVKGNSSSKLIVNGFNFNGTLQPISMVKV